VTERVDFYVLSSAGSRQRFAVGCRLAEKAYLSRRKTWIALPSESEARAVDELLWTFSDGSFVPHHCCGGDSCAERDLPVHVCVGLEGRASPAADLLVNLADRLPDPPLDRFGRIAEIIDADPERRRLGRERFKAYREQGIVLETHQLSSDAGIETLPGG
jgi:DNA polymerase-3 subunit chi